MHKQYLPWTNMQQAVRLSQVDRDKNLIVLKTLLRKTDRSRQNLDKMVVSKIRLKQAMQEKFIKMI